MSTHHESVLTVPVDLVRNTIGLSLDIGGSILKVVYRSKENRREAEAKNAKCGHLQMISFRNDSLGEALDYIKERADITRTGDHLPRIFTSGVGCTLHGKLITDKLSLQLQQDTESDCVAKAFVYLASKLSRIDLLEPFQSKAAEEVVGPLLERISQSSQSEMTDKMADEQFGLDKKQFFDPLNFTGQVISESSAPLSEAEDIFPCILAMCGSALVYMQINKDKTWRIVDASSRGGKTFYAIGGLLTDCKSYEELLDLASNGDPRNVDEYAGDIIKDRLCFEGDESVYSKYLGENKSDIMVYGFGRCHGGKNLKEFKREDLARAWLNHCALDVVQCTQLLCQANGIKRVFFCGSFCNTEIVQRTITVEFARRNLGNLSNVILMCVGVPGLELEPDAVVKFDFIKGGSYLTAIGAMLNEK